MSSVVEFEMRFLPQSESSPLLLLTEMVSYNCAGRPHPPSPPAKQMYICAQLALEINPVLVYVLWYNQKGQMKASDMRAHVGL